MHVARTRRAHMALHDRAIGRAWHCMSRGRAAQHAVRPTCRKVERGVPQRPNSGRLEHQPLTGDNDVGCLLATPCHRRFLPPSPTPPACRIPPAQQQHTPRCPPPEPGKHTSTHPASSAPDAHPLQLRPAETLQCRPRLGRALTPPAQTLCTPQCTPPAAARPGPDDVDAVLIRFDQHCVEYHSFPPTNCLPQRREWAWREPWRARGATV